MTPEDRERLTTLEVEMKHLSQQVSEMKTTVAELRDLLIQARGVRWFLSLMIAAGAFVAGMTAKYLPVLPR